MVGVFAQKKAGGVGTLIKRIITQIETLEFLTFDLPSMFNDGAKNRLPRMTTAPNFIVTNKILCRKRFMSIVMA